MNGNSIILTCSTLTSFLIVWTIVGTSTQKNQERWKKFWSLHKNMRKQKKKLTLQAEKSMYGSPQVQANRVHLLRNAHLMHISRFPPKFRWMPFRTIYAREEIATPRTIKASKNQYNLIEAKINSQINNWETTNTINLSKIFRKVSSSVQTTFPSLTLRQTLQTPIAKMKEGESTTLKTSKQNNHMKLPWRNLKM